MAGRVATADRIADAALRLFTVHGLAGTSMEQIRREAGVSNGSLYHHFPSRTDLAARLLVTGMGRAQRAVVDAVVEVGDAETGIRSVVAAQLGWVEDHPEWARLLLGELPDEVLLAAEPEFGAQNREYLQLVGGWLRAQVERGAVADRPFEITHALWLGPGQEFARHWLSGRTRRRPSQIVGELADGAWRAVRVR